MRSRQPCLRSGARSRRLRSWYRPLRASSRGPSVLHAPDDDPRRQRSIAPSSGTCARPAFRIWSAAPTRSSITPASSATPRTSICSSAAPTGRASTDDAGAAWASRCELVFTHWLGKARERRPFRRHDLRRRQRPGRSRRRLAARTACRRSCSKCRCTWSPAEEMIWSKAFVMERERYDGADITHILRKSGATIDWVRLLRRFGSHAAVLLSHLVLFQFVVSRASRCRFPTG